MNKAKVLFILQLPPPIHGSSVVGQYIKESKVLSEAFHCSYVNIITSKSINDVGKNSLGKVFRYIHILWRVLEKLIYFKPKICYVAITARGIGFYKDALVVLLIKLFGVKLVYHFHNKGVVIRQNHFFDNLLYISVFKNTDVILLSKYLYPDIQKYVIEERIHYCPNGIKERIIQKQTVSKKNYVEILFLSNLIKSKGVYVLLNACKILQNKVLNFHCTFVGGFGDIQEHEFIARVKELALTNYVECSGEKYGKEKEEIFAKADIFVHPSYNDCFPLVLLEAMSHSLPIVSTIEGAIPEIIENEITGFLVPQKDSIALAEKLQLLIQNNDLREEMGRRGRLRLEQNFTIRHFEQNLIKALKRCLLLF